MAKTSKREKCEWRLMMWREVLRSIPVRIVIDVERQCYRVEDSSFRYVYADDIENDEINTIVEEWAEQMKYEDRQNFIQTFSMKQLIEAFKDQRREISLVTELADISNNFVLIRVRFGRAFQAMIIEFTFQAMNVCDGTIGLPLQRGKSKGMKL